MQGCKSFWFFRKEARRYIASKWQLIKEKFPHLTFSLLLTHCNSENKSSFSNTKLIEYPYIVRWLAKEIYCRCHKTMTSWRHRDVWRWFGGSIIALLAALFNLLLQHKVKVTEILWHAKNTRKKCSFFALFFFIWNGRHEPETHQTCEITYYPPNFYTYLEAVYSLVSTIRFYKLHDVINAYL